MNVVVILWENNKLGLCIDSYEQSFKLCVVLVTILVFSLITV